MAVAAPPRSVTVRPVRGRRDLDAFIKLPFRLHKGTPWVPPLVFERRQFLDRDKNPYFEHAEAEYFLAERGGEVVGRISAHVDRLYNEYQANEHGLFGFFECEQDPAIAAALFDAAAEWLAARGRDAMLGPMDFSTNDECGVLIEGYEIPPMILQPWHPPYYRELFEGAGFEKAMDLLMWWLALGELKQGNEFHPFIHEAARKCVEEHGVTIRNMRKRDLENELRRAGEVYIAAFGSNWGFVPPTDNEVHFHIKNLKSIVDTKWTFMAERDGEVMGAALTLPDVNQVLAKMNGRLLPFGWLKFLLGRRKIDRVRVFALGVRPEYQHTGIAAAFYIRHLDNASPDGVPAGETGWILETNEPMNRAMEGMGGEVIKRYRLYQRALSAESVMDPGGSANPVI